MLSFCIAVCVGAFSYFTQPTVEGQKLNRWLEYKYNPSGPGETNANATLRTIGAPAVPTLLRMLQAEDSPLKIKLVDIFSKQQVIPINFVPAGNRHTRALAGFRVLGDKAKGAVPFLILMYRQSSSSSAQQRAVKALGAIGPAAVDAVPLLVDGTTSTNKSLQRVCIAGLGGIRAGSDIAVPALIRCLDDSDLSIQVAAADALGAFGADAKDAVPRLELLRDEQTRFAVRYFFREALKNIGNKEVN
jgi:HEAT repeat protein